MRILSGYATANMADMHMEKLHKKLNQQSGISIELVVGMTARSGIQEAQHLAFQKLTQAQTRSTDLQCSYVTSENPPVHAKAYVWLNREGTPVQAFCGSANYTVQGFISKQVEVLAEADPGKSNRFLDRMTKYARSCDHPGIENLVQIVKDEEPRIKVVSEGASGEEHLRKLRKVNLTLLETNKQEPPAYSGINWGQRENRNKNQAYINIPAKIRNGDFFPERKQPFVVRTDDGEVFTCVRAQDGGKGIHTPHDNSILGAYLRKRIGVPSGERVMRTHLDAYGRIDVTFYKIDSETYLLDFSIN